MRGGVCAPEMMTMIVKLFRFWQSAVATCQLTVGGRDGAWSEQAGRGGFGCQQVKLTITITTTTRTAATAAAIRMWKQMRMWDVDAGYGCAVAAADGRVDAAVAADGCDDNANGGNYKQQQQWQQQQQQQQRESTKVNITFKAEDKPCCRRHRRRRVGVATARRGALPNGKSSK